MDWCELSSRSRSWMRLAPRTSSSPSDGSLRLVPRYLDGATHYPLGIGYNALGFYHASAELNEQSLPRNLCLAALESQRLHSDPTLCRFSTVSGTVFTTRSPTYISGVVVDPLGFPAATLRGS
jgi:hypothetical protein